MARVTQRTMLVLAAAVLPSLALGFLYARERVQRVVLAHRLDALERRVAQQDSDLTTERNATLECLASHGDTARPARGGALHLNDLLERRYRNPEIYRNATLPGLLRDPNSPPR